MSLIEIFENHDWIHVHQINLVSIISPATKSVGKKSASLCDKENMNKIPVKAQTKLPMTGTDIK